MEFRTELRIERSELLLNHTSKTLTIGSCFAEVIGNKLRDYKFPVLSNPFGTIFNPLSISYLLKAALQDTPLPRYSYLNTREVWLNYYLHSSIHAPSKIELETKIEAVLGQVRETILSTDFIIITLGTAFVYKHLENQETVANCHKMPGNIFSKQLLTPEEIIEEYKSLLDIIRQHRPGINIILTVSPVRHLKDSIPLNSVSKSILRYTAYKLSTDVEKCFYFPAFEILMDDLRDYRFYKEDLIHPTVFAEEYIWEKFGLCFFSEETHQLNEQLEKLLKVLSHKPFNSRTSTYQTFLKDTLNKLQKLSSGVDLSAEIQFIEDQLKKA